VTEKKTTWIIVSVLVSLTLVLAIISFVLFNGFGLLSIISYGSGITPDSPQYEETLWQGNEVKLESTWFGDLTSSNNYRICGNKYGDVFISNSYTSNEKFILNSAMSSSDQHCTGNNIKANINLPAGKLIGTYYLTYSMGLYNEIMATCTVKSGSKTIFNSYLHLDERDSSGKKDFNFEIILKEPTSIEVYLEDGVGGGLSSGTSLMVELEFEEYQDPCEEIICDDKCEDSIRYSNGYCSEGECVYETDTCQFGCLGDFCAENPCIGVTCDDKCEDSIWYQGGNCVNGECVYSFEDTCEFGCQDVAGFLALIVGGEMCREDPCIGVECEDYCIGDELNTLATEGKCVNGECVYPSSGEKPSSEECGFVPWYKNLWVWAGVITFIIVIVFSYMYYQRRIK